MDKKKVEMSVEENIDEMKKYQGKLEKTSSQSFRKKSKKPIDNKKRYDLKKVRG